MTDADHAARRAWGRSRDGRERTCPGRQAPSPPRAQSGKTIHVCRLPGIAASVRDARLFVARAVAEEQTGQDVAPLAMQVASELATNAVRHTRSGNPGGFYDLYVEFTAAGLVVAVVDQGGHKSPAVRVPGPESTCGRGLILVGALAAEWGVRGGVPGRRVEALFRLQ